MHCSRYNACMNQSDHNLYTAEQVRELDRLAIASGISGYELMCRAGQAAYDELRKCWPEAQFVTVLCGAGNNAGDGYVIARLVHQAGLAAHVYYLSDPEKLTADAHRAWQDAMKSGVQVEPFVTGIHYDTDIIVDAMLGTGLERDLQGAWLTAVNCVNDYQCPVLAVDIPTGIHADTGCAMEAAVCADVTVSFIGLKRGLWTGDALDYAGHLIFHGLDIPPTVYQQVAIDSQLMPPEPGSLLPPRSRTAHKGDFGHVLVIGGNKGMAGATILAAMAALRTGAGRVSVATRPEHVPSVVSACPELMVHGIAAHEELMPVLRRCTTVVIGPGLGQDRWAKSLFSGVLESRKPMVIDADALNLLAQEPHKYQHWVLTPHPAEAGRLLGITTRKILADRFLGVRELQRRYGGVVVLKGAGTLIHQSETTVCRAGNPGMATAGMGDVLSGIIAGLMAQGLNNCHAAEYGVWLHASAADCAAEASGQVGLIASDLLQTLPPLLP